MKLPMPVPPLYHCVQRADAVILTYGYFLVINEIIFINMVTVSLLVTP